MMDEISLRTLIWLVAIVLVALLICLCVVGFRAAEAWGERSRANSSVQEAQARIAEANAKEAEWNYQKALMDRVGGPVATLMPITLALPQAQLDKLALDTVRQRIAALKVRIET